MSQISLLVDGVAQTVEGNTYPGNKIRSSSRKLNTGNKTTSIYGYYRLI